MKQNRTWMWTGWRGRTRDSLRFTVQPAEPDWGFFAAGLCVGAAMMMMAVIL